MFLLEGVACSYSDPLLVLDAHRLTSVPEHAITQDQMLQVWAILQSLHAVGIVHRDLRAANMKCDESG